MKPCKILSQVKQAENVVETMYKVNGGGVIKVKSVFDKNRGIGKAIAPALMEYFRVINEHCK